MSLTVTVGCAMLSKKIRALGNFTIGLSMILGIVAAVAVELLLKK